MVRFICSKCVMANVSKPANLFSPTDFAVLGLKQKNNPIPSATPAVTSNSSPKKRLHNKPKKSIKKKTRKNKAKAPLKKGPAKKKQAGSKNRKKNILPWM